MKGSLMESQWRTVQIFLSPRCNVFEAEVDQSNGAVRCNCPGFKARSTCKHTRFVKARIEGNNGTYPLMLSTRTPKDRVSIATRSRSEFRDFVIKYGRIEVL